MKRIISLLLTIALFLGTTAVVFGCGVKKDSVKNTAGTGAGTVTADTPQSPVREESPALRITEVLAQNSFGQTAPDGKCHPWIEFYAESDVKLSEYSLIYSETTPYRLPELTLKGGEYYLLFVYEEGFPHTLSGSARLTLMHGELLCSSFVYISRRENVSFDVAGGFECTAPTPGSGTPGSPRGIIINEMMTSNTLFPVNGSACDWIELYNSGSAVLTLSDYFISDDPENPYKAQLTGGTVNPGEYVVISSGVDFPFGLSSDGETVCLTGRDGITQSVMTVGASEKNMSFITDGFSKTPSPGYPNGYDGMVSAICGRRGLVINEVVSSNSGISPLKGQYCDMAELINNSDSDIQLSDYFISDKASVPEKYRLPERVLKPGELYVVYFPGSGDGYPDFGISAEGEKLYITRSDGFLSDALAIPALYNNISWGRYNGSSLAYFEVPTIGKANQTKGAYAELSGVPEIDIKPGVYSGSVSLRLEGEGDIYYTVDGSAPTLSSKKYAGETITLTETGAVRAFCKNGGRIASRTSTFDYLINAPDYSLGVLKISMDREDFDGSGGIYTNPYDRTIEVPINLTLISGGSVEFSVNCGLKVFGAGSRKHGKKSYQVKFRSEYGPSVLKYKVFEQLDINEFNSLILRSGAQDRNFAMMRDEFGTSVASEAGLTDEIFVQAYRPVNLYLNNEYLGVYYIREKTSEETLAAHYGVSPESITVVQSMGSVEAGSAGGEWKALWKYIADNSLSGDAEYNYVIERISLDSIIDYYILQFWSCNFDTSNVRVWKSDEGDGKWRFVFYDLDMAFDYSGQDYLTKRLKFADSARTTTYTQLNALIYKLLENDEFVALFKSRLSELAQTALSDDAVLARISAIENEISHDMVYNYERWKVENIIYNGEKRTYVYPSYEKWKTSCLAVLRARVTGRAQALISELEAYLNG